MRVVACAAWPGTGCDRGRARRAPGSQGLRGLLGPSFPRVHPWPRPFETPRPSRRAQGTSRSSAWTDGRSCSASKSAAITSPVAPRSSSSPKAPVPRTARCTRSKRRAQRRDSPCCAWGRRPGAGGRGLPFLWWCMPGSRVCDHAPQRCPALRRLTAGPPVHPPPFPSPSQSVLCRAPFRWHPSSKSLWCPSPWTALATSCQTPWSICCFPAQSRRAAGG